MPNLLARLGRAYGASPLHLLALVTCFTLTGYVGPIWPATRWWRGS